MSCAEAQKSVGRPAATRIDRVNGEVEQHPIARGRCTKRGARLGNVGERRAVTVEVTFARVSRAPPRRASQSASEIVHGTLRAWTTCSASAIWAHAESVLANAVDVTNVPCPLSNQRATAGRLPPGMIAAILQGDRDGRVRMRAQPIGDGVDLQPCARSPGLFFDSTRSHELRGRVEQECDAPATRTGSRCPRSQTPPERRRCAAT